MISISCSGRRKLGLKIVDLPVRYAPGGTARRVSALEARPATAADDARGGAPDQVLMRMGLPTADKIRVAPCSTAPLRDAGGCRRDIGHLVCRRRVCDGDWIYRKASIFRFNLFGDLSARSSGSSSATWLRA